MANFGPLTAEIRSEVWGTPANATGFASWLCYAAMSLNGGQLKFARCLAVWPVHGLVHYIYIFESSCPCNGILLGAKFTLRPSLAFSYIGSVTARHSSSGRQPNFAAWYKESNYGTLADGDAYFRLGGHQVGNRPTF